MTVRRHWAGAAFDDRWRDVARDGTHYRQWGIAAGTAP